LTKTENSDVDALLSGASNSNGKIRPSLNLYRWHTSDESEFPIFFFNLILYTKWCQFYSVYSIIINCPEAWLYTLFTRILLCVSSRCISIFREKKTFQAAVCVCVRVTLTICMISMCVHRVLQGGQECEVIDR